MGFDPYAPYGPVVESAVRVVTWNVWGRYGPQWEARQGGPISCAVLGIRPPQQDQISDHYGVLADLRY